MAPIGIIGIGRMGLPVCARLVKSGFAVVATDLNAGRRSAVQAAGASWIATAQEVADAAGVLVTVLPGSPELDALMRGLLPGMRPGVSWIDLTSTSPRVGAELRAIAAGIECLDAPMGGGVAAAQAGTLELFVGGPPDSVERHRALLEALGRINHVGDAGTGQVVKLLVNLLWFGQALATGEALLLARRVGIELPAVRAALANSAADSRFIRDDLGALLHGDYLTDFGLDRCVEELVAITELADEVRVPFELSALVRDLHARALERYGPRDGELLGVAMLEEIAGITVRE